jgi:hypothetical protein
MMRDTFKIPEEMEELILQVRGAGDIEFWTIGDACRELVDELGGKYFSKSAIRTAVADLAGLKPSAVRDYEANARFYSSETRKAFPLFTRWHFRVAKAAGDDAHFLLESWYQSMDEFAGKPPPIRWCMAQMNQDKEEIDPFPEAINDFHEAWLEVRDSIAARLNERGWLLLGTANSALQDFFEHWYEENSD